MSLEILEGCKRKYILKIPKDIIEGKVKKELQNKYAQKVKIDGFRQGKAPFSMIEQRYGMLAYEDVINDEVNDVFKKYINDNQIEIVSPPEFKLVNSEDAEFVFEVVFETVPDFTIGDLSKERVEKLECVIMDNDIDDTISQLQKQRVSYAEANKVAQSGDKVTIDFVGTLDGVEFAGGKAEDYVFVLGQNQMLPEFEAGIHDMHLNENKIIEVTFPADYQASELKGKTTQFSITLKKVEQAQLPEVDETFIKSLGIDSGDLETLKSEIRKTLNLELKKRLEAGLRQNALNALSNVTEVELPNGLVHDEIHRLIDEARADFKQRGYKLDAIDLTHDMFRADAKFLVKMRLLVRKFIEDHKLVISEEEVKNIVKDMASLYDDEEEYINWFYKDKKQVEQAYSLAMEKKIVDEIVKLTEVVPVNITYAELVKKSN